MKALFYGILLIGLWGCSSAPIEGDSLSAKEETTSVSTVKDSVIELKEQALDSFPQSMELIIYPFYKNHFENEYQAGFIPLTDSYKWSEHVDSLILGDENLGIIEYENDNYHTMSNRYRSRFLSRAEISEDDQIFIYSVVLDSIEVHNVKDIPLVAFITPYGTQEAVNQRNYQVGFEIKNSTLTGEYHNTFVYVGQINPFNRGELVPISWSEIDNDKFPQSILSHQDSIKLSAYKNLSPLKTYTFKYKELEYYAQNLGQSGNTRTRLVKVFSSKSGENLFFEVYNDSEGAYSKPLNGVENAQDGAAIQWTGRLFRNRPPVIFGMLGMSFGCPGISFIHDSEPKIWIRCDNRH